MARAGTVYSETVVHLAPAAYAEEVPYQVGIVRLDDGISVTARIVGERAAIGDVVVEVDAMHHAPAFRKV